MEIELKSASFQKAKPMAVLQALKRLMRRAGKHLS
jgi:hypothetical protein